MVRKNLKLLKAPSNLVDAHYIAAFLGISLNALYLRMHFDNFVKATKINGKLYFDLNEVLAYLARESEDDSYCFLVQDEIRALVESSKLTRREIGEALCAKNPLTVGGGVYSRGIGLERAKKLHAYLRLKRLGVEFDESGDFARQKTERLEYILEVWDIVINLVDSKKIDFKFLAKAISSANNNGAGRSIYKLSPSYKSAKIIKLRLLQKELI